MSTELAWAAGFYDGEGCTALSKRGTVTLIVSQNRVEPLERFRAAVGFGRIYGPYGNNHQLHILRDDEARRTLELLWPYLSRPKREQAEEALSKGRPNVVPRPSARLTSRA